jgi:16S rRNA (guanine527-N7)-methyltransferase
VVEAQQVLNVTAKQIETAFAGAGIAPLPASAYGRFCAYLELLRRWNQHLNLTAVRDPEQIIQRHFVETAFAAQHLPHGLASLLDYGSGAGFPGIPIAISRPEIRVTLAEAQGKKASFLREVVRVLNISAEIYAGRVEKMPGQLRFDAVSMRAVERMELAIPIAVQRARCYLVLFTTESSAPAYSKLAQELEWLKPIPLPNTEQRIFVIGRRV